MRSFCPLCGTQLTFEHDDALDEIDVTTCSLDDPEWLPPEDHTRTSSKLGWVKLSDGLPEYREARYEGGRDAQPVDAPDPRKRASPARTVRWTLTVGGGRQATAVDLLINVDVDDLEAAIAFYQRGVGLRVGRRLFEGTVVEMLGASSPIYLMEKKAGTSASAYTSQFRDYGRHWTPVHLDFIVDDVAAAARNALAAGAKLEGELQSFSWGRQATMSDPFGHGLCFVQWLGKGYSDAP